MWITPDAGQSTSISTLSVSSRYRTWPTVTCSPSAASHSTMVPSVTATPACGILIGVRPSSLTCRTAPSTVADEGPDALGDPGSLRIVARLQPGRIGDGRVHRTQAFDRGRQPAEEVA